MADVYIYKYIISTPDLGLAIAVPEREREQGRFRGSIEEASREHEGVRREQGRAPREHYRAVQRRSRWESEMTSFVSAQAALVVFYCLEAAVYTQPGDP